MKVFLGGTCPGFKWRDILIPMINCDYYNPIVKNWNEECRLKELHEREHADYILYTITNDIKGVYSIAEVVDDSNKKPQKTLFCNLYTAKTYSEKQMMRSLMAVEKMLQTNGVQIFHSLEEVAMFLNNKI